MGQANDPVNPAGNWTSSAGFKNILTESATDLRYRDDLQLVSGPMLNENGMQLVPGTYTAFGNNGTTSYGGSVTASNNTALADLPNRSAVLSALTTVTDHLPLVADYTFVGAPAPPIPGDVNMDGVVNGLDINIVASEWAQSGPDWKETQTVTELLTALISISSPHIGDKPLEGALLPYLNQADCCF